MTSETSSYEISSAFTCILWSIAYHKWFWFYQQKIARKGGQLGQSQNFENV